MAMDLSQVPDQEEEAVVADIGAILSEELTKISKAKGVAVDTQINTRMDAQVGQRVTTSLDAAYNNLVGTNEVVVAHGVPGARTVAMFGNTREVTDPRTNKTIFVAPRPEFQAAMLVAPHSDSDTVKAAYERSGSPTKQFSVQEQLKHLQTLTGDELLQAASTLRLNIHLEAAKERDTIRRNAAMQSGLLEAETVLAQNKALDRAKGGVFLTQSSYQTLQAQALVDQAHIRANRYEASLVTSNPMLAELGAAEKVLDHTAEWRGKQDIQAANRRLEAESRGAEALALFDYKEGIKNLNARELAANKQLDRLAAIGITQGSIDARFETAMAAKAQIRLEKTALLRASVRDTALTNYHIIYGTSGDDNTDREIIMSRQDKAKEKELFQVLNADDTSIVEMLSDNDPSVREKAVKLVNGWEMNLNAGVNKPTAQDYLKAPEGVTATIARSVIKDIDSPKKFTAEMKAAGVGEEVYGPINTALLAAASKEEKARARFRATELLMNVRLDKAMKDQLRGDVRSWKTSETTAGPLKEAIDKVRSSDGKVSFMSFIGSVFQSPLKDEAGAPLSDDDKVALMNRAIGVATQTAFKSPLYRKQQNEALRDSMQSTMNNIVMFTKVQKLLTGAFTMEGYRMIFGGPDRNAVEQGASPEPMASMFLGAP